MIGETILQYKILEKLGEGGMGVVYKAHDVKLDRVVALKFLPHHLTANEAEQARFLQEAKSAAALNHPNACAVYDIREHDGRQFIVMEYLDGETLRRKVPVARVDDALKYAVQIGEALQEAHGKGIVHRDIKCENIMVTSKNQIKVMDFGLAKLKGSLKLTRTSSTVGTLAYMSPEQIQGGEVDARSDLFSFGVVVFEMLTGRLPFRGEHEAAMMYSIMNEPAATVAEYLPGISPEIGRIVARALEKDPEDRYQSAADMTSELRRVQKQSTRVTRTSAYVPPAPSAAAPAPAELPPPAETREAAPTRRGGPNTLIAIAGFVVLAAIGGYFLFLRSAGSIDSIAVLPFTNAGGDPNAEYLSDGITESIINSLSQVSNLTVMSRSSVFRFKGKDPDPQNAGKSLGVKAVLTGRVMQRGDDLLISTELVNVADNSHIWGEQYNRKFSDILSVQGEIASEITDKLSLRLAGEEAKKLTKRSTENTAAYQSYLKGRFFWNKRKADDIRKAIGYFNEAIGQDPNYALAYAGLALASVLLPEYAGVPPRDAAPQAESAAKKALELDPSLAEPHAVLGLIKYAFQWDWKGAEIELRRAIELNPSYPTAHHWLSISYRNSSKFAEGLDEIRKAQALDPLSPVIALNVGECLHYLNRDDDALDQWKKVLDLDPNFPGAFLDMGTLDLQHARYKEAIAEFLKAREILGPDNLYGIGILGYAYASSGERGEAEKILARLEDASAHGAAQSTQIATVHIGLGNKEKCLDWLERAYAGEEPALGYVPTARIFDPLKGEPRYAALLRKLNLE